MENSQFIEVKSDSILELAAMACLTRAEEHQNLESKCYAQSKDELAVIHRIRRDEADECKNAIRSLKSFRTDNEFEMVKNASMIMYFLAVMFRNPEYIDLHNKLNTMYRQMAGNGGTWPFPVQPGSPPFCPTEPVDESEKTT